MFSSFSKIGYLFVGLLIVLPLYLQSQPLRVGLKGGLPFIWALNVEYMTPLLKSNLAANLDVSYYSTPTGNFTYVDLGGNYYFLKQSPAELYSGLSFLSVFTKSTLTTSSLKADLSGYMNAIIVKTGATFKPMASKFPQLILKAEFGYTLFPRGTLNTRYNSGGRQTTERVNLNNMKGSLIANIGLVIGLNLFSRSAKPGSK